MGELLCKDDQEQAIWQAIQNIRLGNKTDDKLIVAELKALGFTVCRIATHPQPVTPAGGEVEPELWQYRYQYRDQLGWSDWLDVSPKQKADMGAVVAMFASNGVAVETRKFYTHPPVADAALVECLSGLRREMVTMTSTNSMNFYIHRRWPELIDAALNQRGGG